MSMNFETLKGVVRSSYDRILLFTVLVGLLFSVGWLIVRLGEAKNDLKSQPWAIAEKQQKETKKLDLAFLEDAISKLGDSNDVRAVNHPAMMVAAIRVSCVKCKKPILFDAKTCSFCGQAQPEDPKIAIVVVDTDNDGVPDEWEKKYNFNPNNPADANSDPDDDCFTNLEEFQCQTNPRDKEDAPPLALKLRLVKVTITPLNLVLTSLNRVGSNDFFTIKNKTTQQDYFIKLGDKVEGYEIVSFEKKYNDIIRGGMPFKEDVSVVVMKKETRTLKLVMGKDVNQEEIVAELKFIPEEKNYFVKISDVMNLKGYKHNVIDIKREFVVICDDKSSKTFRVKKDTVEPAVEAADAKTQ